MKVNLLKGSTSVILTVFIQDSSATTGAGLGSLIHTSSIVGGYLKKNGTGVALAVDEDVTTEGTYQAPSAAGKVRIGTPANMRTGWYELHFHNDLFTTVDWVSIGLGAATNMAELTIEVQLVDLDPNISVASALSTYAGPTKSEMDTAHGLLATEAKQDVIDQNVDDIEADTSVMQPLLDTLSNALVLTSAVIETVTSQTALVIPDTADATDDQAYHGALAVLIDASDPNQKSIRIVEAYNASTRTVTLSKAPDFTVTTADTITILATSDAGGVWDMLLTGSKHNIQTSAGRRLRSVDVAIEVHSGTAQAGAAGTITLDTGASTVNDIYQGDRIVIVGGTGAQEHGICIGYVGSTRVATMAENWVVTPDNTSEFEIVPASVDVKTWLHKVVTASAGGLPDVNVNEVGDTSQTAGDLANLISAIPTTAMRGTDNAALASVLGALNDAAAADDPTTGDTLMQYQKQLVNLLAGSTGIGTMPAGANPANGVNLFEMVRAGLGATFDTATDSLEQLQGDILAIDDFLDTEIAAILVDTNSLNDTKIPDTISLANIKTQVTDAWSVDTHAEIGQALPPATATFAQMLGLLYKAWRNRSTQTSSEYKLYADNTTTVDQKAAVSDDATTFDKGEVATGP